MSELHIPEDPRYDLAHVWVKADGATATVGITDFAQACWGRVEFAQLPEVSERVRAGAAVGQLLCADAGPCDLLSPLSGRVTAVNDALVQEPALANDDPYGEGWLFRLQMSDPAELRDLMDAGAYRQALAAPLPEKVEETLATVFAHSVDAMILIDPYRRVLAMNPAAERLTGYRPAEAAAGCRCHHLLCCEGPEGTLHGVSCPGVSLGRGIRPAGPARFTLTRRNGERVRVSASYSPLPRPDGAAPLVLVSFREEC